MPKKVTAKELVEKIEWVADLPETAWSAGVFSSSAALAEEIEELELKRASLDKEIGDRMKLLRMTVRRVEKEAPLVYTKEQIKSAVSGDEPEPPESSSME